MIPPLQEESMAKLPSSPLTAPLTKAESVLFNNTTLANAKGSPLVFITLPVIFCAIIGVIAERHNAVVKNYFFLHIATVLLDFLFFCCKSIAL